MVPTCVRVLDVLLEGVHQELGSSAQGGLRPRTAAKRTQKSSWWDTAEKDCKPPCTALKDPQTSPIDPSRSLQDLPRSPIDPFQDTPKIPHRSPKIPPRSFQDTPKIPQDTPKIPPRSLQDLPQETSQILKPRPKSGITACCSARKSGEDLRAAGAGRTPTIALLESQGRKPLGS